MPKKKPQIKSKNYYKFATLLRVHHQDLNPQGRQPIITANTIANIHFHVNFHVKIVMI